MDSLTKVTQAAHRRDHEMRGPHEGAAYPDIQNSYALS